jgi:hypothetical protein
MMGCSLMQWRRLMGAVVVGQLLLTAEACAQEEGFALNTWIGGSAIHSGSFGVSLGYAPGGSIRRSGLRLQAVALRGFYRYPSDAAPRGSVHGRYTDYSLLLGYEVVGAGYGFGIAIGPSLYEKNLSYAAAGDWTGSRVGTKVSAIGYVGLLKGISAFSFGSYSTADSTANLYANLGVTLPGGLSTGPEVALLNASDYRQTRIGLHLSGLSLGRTQMSMSFGATRDMNGNRGRHFGMSAQMTF